MSRKVFQLLMILLHLLCISLAHFPSLIHVRKRYINVKYQNTKRLFAKKEKKKIFFGGDKTQGNPTIRTHVHVFYITLQYIFSLNCPCSYFLVMMHDNT